MEAGDEVCAEPRNRVRGILIHTDVRERVKGFRRHDFFRHERRGTTDREGQRAQVEPRAHADAQARRPVDEDGPSRLPINFAPRKRVTFGGRELPFEQRLDEGERVRARQASASASQRTREREQARTIPRERRRQAVRGKVITSSEISAATLLELGPLLAYHMSIDKELKVPWYYAFAYPLAAFLFEGILAQSAWRVLLRKGIDWRGRRYYGRTEK